MQYRSKCAISWQRGAGMVVGWLIPRAVPYPRRRRGTEGPQSNYGHDPHMLHFDYFFFSSSLPFTKLFSLNCLLRKKLLHYGTCFKVGWGRGGLG